jgi:hypothetical protein
MVDELRVKDAAAYTYDRFHRRLVDGDDGDRRLDCPVAPATASASKP